MRLVEKALTFDDVLLLPAHSVVLPRNVNLTTRLTRAISLNIPLVSAAMDTVTEARLAIALAQEGGIGIIHKNMPAESQAAHVAKVKRFESGVVKEPITIPPDMTVREVLNLIHKYKISGLPVVDQRTGAIPGFRNLFVREVLGRLLSGLFLSFVYIWALFDKNAQTWHDKLAGTVVVKKAA